MLLFEHYTLPYIKIIRELNVFESSWLLVMNGKIREAKHSVIENLNIVELPYENVGFYSFFKIYFYIKKLVKKQNITNLHAWCTPAGSIALQIKRFHNKHLHLVIDSYRTPCRSNGGERRMEKKFIEIQVSFQVGKTSGKKC